MGASSSSNAGKVMLESHQVAEDQKGVMPQLQGSFVTANAVFIAVILNVILASMVGIAVFVLFKRLNESIEKLAQSGDNSSTEDSTGATSSGSRSRSNDGGGDSPRGVAVVKKSTVNSPHKANASTGAGYRIEVEGSRFSSHEYSDRGILWTQHARWHLPTAPRVQMPFYGIYKGGVGLDYVTGIISKFNVDPDTGFLPKHDPLQRLPYARYHLWEDLADDLPKLLGVRMGQARGPLKALPALATDKLTSDADLRRAHLLLSLFAHAYVWGGADPLDVIPEGIAKPLLEVSRRLDIPPVLSHVDLVLYNWRRLDEDADICMENLSTLNNFFDGRDESWFYLITTEIEARGAATIVPMMLTMDAIQRFNHTDNADKKEYTPSMDVFKALGSEEKEVNEEIEAETEILLNNVLVGSLTPRNVARYITGQLNKMHKAILGMCLSIEAMNEGCHPFIFYHRVRPFLSGWKNNPILADGVVYAGTGDERHFYYGGSAAQSALIPFLDICFGIDHSKSRSNEFLLAMRDYMLKPHREFLKYCEDVSCLRQYVVDTMSALNIDLEGTEVTQDSEHLAPFLGLRESFNSCILGIKRFRNGHMKLVSDYIIKQHKGGAVAGDEKLEDNKVVHDESSGVAKGIKKSFENSAGGKGTGGTDLMTFLKPIRDNVSNTVVGPVTSAQKIAAKKVPIHGRPETASPEPLAESSGDNESKQQQQPYFKSNSDRDDLNVYVKPAGPEFADLDAFRGCNNFGSISGVKSHYKVPPAAAW